MAKKKSKFQLKRPRPPKILGKGGAHRDKKKDWVPPIEIEDETMIHDWMLRIAKYMDEQAQQNLPVTAEYTKAMGDPSAGDYLRASAEVIKAVDNFLTPAQNNLEFWELYGSTWLAKSVDELRKLTNE